MFDTFPLPQSPTSAQLAEVAERAVRLRKVRRQLMAENQMSLRELYRLADLPGQNPLKECHADLDAAVRAAYGMKPQDDALTFLLELNQQVHERESKNSPVTGPGLPTGVPDPKRFVTSDCVRPEGFKSLESNSAQ